MWAPWHVLLHWSPFKIDALGLVTLLGAEEINAAVGRLVSSAYLEGLPLLGAYVIAGDRFTEKVAGWNLYNISQGIHTTDLAAWLTRWMLSQEFETTRSYVKWTVTKPQSRTNETITSILISVLLNGFLIAGTVASADWYGLANALAMDISIIVRVYVIGQQRLAVDAMIDEAITKINPPPEKTYEAGRHDYKVQKRERKENKSEGVRNRKTGAKPTADEQHSNHSDSSSTANGHKPPQPPKNLVKPKAKDYPDADWEGKPIKVLIIQSDSKAVTFSMPNELVIPRSLFIEGPQILNPNTYYAMRFIGWIAFAVHIVAIGMADLATQIYTVILIVLPTLLLINKTGCDDSNWSNWSKAFSGWRRSIFHSHGGENSSNASGKTQAVTNGSGRATESGGAAELRFVRQCWVGSRLKAEVYEWPESYEFYAEGEGDNKTWKSGSPNKKQERSTRRQDLYAWLALSHDEEESMDKWDLFPHIRNDENLWWTTYKEKKHALVGKSGAGLPTHSLETSAEQQQQDPRGASSSSRNPQDDWPHHNRQPNRTNTALFMKKKAELRQGSGGPAGGSPAFPALTAHGQEDAQAVDDSQTADLTTHASDPPRNADHPLPGDSPADSPNTAATINTAPATSLTSNTSNPGSPDAASSTDPGAAASTTGPITAPSAQPPPRINTQSSATASSAHVDPAAGVTDSPTVMSATDEQP